MDLGIAGKWALVCGSSKGLGLGCAQALDFARHFLTRRRPQPGHGLPP